jgi:hypothetical protein
MAVVSAVRSNPLIKNFYAQLRARGKYPKSALTACLRKFLVMLHAMLHNNTHWHTTALTPPPQPFISGGAVSEHGCFLGHTKRRRISFLLTLGALDLS